MRPDESEKLAAHCGTHAARDLQRTAGKTTLIPRRVWFADRMWAQFSTGPPCRHRTPGRWRQDAGHRPRLADSCNQIDVTWNLYAMEPDELLPKLPREVERFQPPL